MRRSHIKIFENTSNTVSVELTLKQLIKLCNSLLNEYAKKF